MDKNLEFEKSIIIKAPASKVWMALTNPAMIKQYLFGTETITDWKKGGSIIFQGVWEDKPYIDKGTITEIKSEKRLQYTYWSSFSNTPDKPENYSTIEYELLPEKIGTRFTLSQKGFSSPEARDHSASNWSQVLESIKKLVEGTK
jgi:uncharacterized protein YndB with AHSA1/START domain